MARYKVQFAHLSQVCRVVPFNGLTMREIYSRFVMTGQRPVENTNTVHATEDDPYNPSEDALSRALYRESVENAILSEESGVSNGDSSGDAPAGE